MYGFELNSVAVVVVVLSVVLWLVHPLLAAVWELCQCRRNLSQLYPSPPYHWFWGHSFPAGLNHKTLMTFVSWMEIYPRSFALYLGPLRSTIFVCHPDTVKDVLRVNEGKYMGPGPSFYTLSQSIMGDGLLNSCGAKWFRNRRLLTPAFHFGILKGYVEVFNEIAKDFCQGLSSDPDAQGGVEIFQAASICTLRALIRCAFSCTDELPIHGGNAAYLDTMDRVTHLLAKRLFTWWLYPDFIFYRTEIGKEFLAESTNLREVALKFIHSRQKTISEKKSSMKNQSLDFLDILLLAEDDEGNQLKEEEILDEVRTFIFAGFDTTKSAIGFLLYNLAKNPEDQTQARDEVDELVRVKGHNNIEIQDLLKLPFVTMCVKESLRLFPPANFSTRKISQPTVIDGQHVPINTWISVSIWAMHHNPVVWGTDHMEFKPQRFSEAQVAARDSHAYVPFSAGPRNCIGQNFALNEIKVFAAHVLHKFQVKLHPSAQLNLAYEGVLKNKDGIRLCFEERPIPI